MSLLDVGSRYTQKYGLQWTLNGAATFAANIGKDAKSRYNELIAENFRTVLAPDGINLNNGDFLACSDGFNYISETVYASPNGRRAQILKVNGYLTVGRETTTYDGNLNPTRGFGPVLVNVPCLFHKALGAEKEVPEGEETDTAMIVTVQRNHWQLGPIVINIDDRITGIGYVTQYRVADVSQNVPGIQRLRLVPDNRA